MSTKTSNNTSSYANTLKTIPTKKQAILLPSDSETNLIDYVIGLGRVIGPQYILSASKISKNRICIYLDSENTVESFIKTGGQITVNNEIITARKLVSPSKRIILSNVHSCIPNYIILDALREINLKTCSAIHNLHIGTSSKTFTEEELSKYKHITSFRRGVYIDDTNNTTLPNSLLINYDNENHRIFINDGELRCHICSENSHNADQCPTIENTSTMPGDEESGLIVQPETSLTFQEKLQIARNTRDKSSQP